MRETDRDWAEIGRTEPFFGVLADPRFFRDNLTDDVLEDFWRSGRVDIDYVLNTIRHHLGDFDPTDALDFGCGVGRLTRAMARHCARVTGVDISPGMLEIANRYAPPNMVVGTAIPDALFDWVNSSIVLQHIPPQRGYDIFETLLDRVMPGGAFSIHVTFFKDGEYIEWLRGTLERGSWDGEVLRHVHQAAAPGGAMLMYDYDLTRLMIAATTRGFDNFYMDHVNHGGCHGVMMYGRRRR